MAGTRSFCRWRPSTTLYTEEVAVPLEIRRFAGDIEVPVFLASAWQDEQTGPSFADLLDKFDASPPAAELLEGISSGTS